MISTCESWRDGHIVPSSERYVQTQHLTSGVPTQHRAKTPRPWVTWRSSKSKRLTHVLPVAHPKVGQRRWRNTWLRPPYTVLVLHYSAEQQGYGECTGLVSLLLLLTVTTRDGFVLPDTTQKRCLALSLFQFFVISQIVWLSVDLLRRTILFLQELKTAKNCSTKDAPWNLWNK